MPTKLNNLRHNVQEVEGKQFVRVQANIDKEIYDYFFHHVIAYRRGVRQILIRFFFQRLYEEFKNRGIPAVWDEDNDQKILDIINNLNFNDNTITVGNELRIGGSALRQNVMTDPLAPDAPIIHWLSISKNPAVKDMSTEQLNELVKRCRTMATSPQTLTAAIQSEAKRKRPKTAAQLKRQSILDSM